MTAPIMSRFDLFFIILDSPSPQTDTHLARHIVSVHALRDAAVDPEFSTAQLQRYIHFARTFKPTFTPEARARLVLRYKELRADDAQGGAGRNSYRITVRQLESMIRLSEAVAKANCVVEVTEEFVDEAFRLLRSSIISVEKEDVEFEREGEGEDEEDDGEGRAAADEDEEMREYGAEDASETTPRPTRTRITHDKYVSMLTRLVRRVDEDERAQGDGVEEGDLVLWYLEQIEEELQSTEDMEREGALVRKVIKRMVKDSVLMMLRGEGLADEEGEGLGEEKVVYVVHPNFAVEEVAGRS